MANEVPMLMVAGKAGGTTMVMRSRARFRIVSHAIYTVSARCVDSDVRTHAELDKVDCAGAEAEKGDNGQDADEAEPASGLEDASRKALLRARVTILRDRFRRPLEPDEGSTHKFEAHRPRKQHGPNECAWTGSARDFACVKHRTFRRIEACAN
jgi:hypothetical protein